LVPEFTKGRECVAFPGGDEIAFSPVMLRTLSSLQFWIVLKQGSATNAIDLKGIAARLSQLFSPCAFGHGDTLRTRDENGYLALECADCGQVRRVLATPAIKGPKHHAAPIKGAPLSSARPVKQERRYPRSA
jgi:hypothetical protein